MTFDEWWAREGLSEASAGLSPDAMIRLAWAAATERAAKIAERTATLCEQRVKGEPERAKYDVTYETADRHCACELRDVALLIREGT